MMDDMNMGAEGMPSTGPGSPGSSPGLPGEKLTKQGSPGGQGASGHGDIEEKGHEIAENLRDKSHEAAGAAVEGMETLSSTAKRAADYLHQGEEMVKQVEQKVDQLISLAESVLDKGAKYGSAARSFLNQHPEYRDRAGEAIAKVKQVKDRVKEKLSERTNGGAQGAYTGGHGEGRGEHLADALRERGEEFREGARARVEEVKEAAQQRTHEFGEQAQQKVADGKAMIRQRASQAAGYARENPIEVLVVGAATGVLIGAMAKHLAKGG